MYIDMLPANRILASDLDSARLLRPFLDNKSSSSFLHEVYRPLRLIHVGGFRILFNMDPVAAFGLACGVIQVVSFSIDLVQMCKALYKQDSLIFADIATSAEYLKDLNSKLESSRLIRDISAVPKPIDTELLELAQKCSQTAQKLIDEMDKLKAPRKRDVFGKAIKILFHHQGVLAKLQAQMEGYQRTLDTHVMIDLRRTLGLVLSEQTNAFQKLDKSMQDIARKVVAEPMTCDTMAKLLQDHSTSITDGMSQKLQTLELSWARRLYGDKVLASLHFPEIHSRQEEVAEAHQETFQWIFDDSGGAMRPWANFVDWLKTESDTYWISGKAGSGKSTLMNYILQDERTMETLRAWAEPKDIVCLSFFFWAAGSKLQRTVAGLLRSLLYQILEQFRDLISGTTRGIEGVRSFATGVHEFEPIVAWTERRLSDTLQRIVRAISSSCCVCFFIDGLDEVEKDHYKLIEIIQRLASWPAVKCCVSSRAEPPFFKAFKSSSMLRLQDLTRSDIERFVSAKLKAIPEMGVFVDRPNPRPHHPVDLIVTKAEGVFLWVQLAVNSQMIGIENDDDIEVLWQRLEALPTEINDLYRCMLKRIDKIYEREAAQYLRLAYLLTSGLDSDPSVLQIVLALHYTGDELYKKPDMSKIASQCGRATKRINITCAGLIYCHGHEKNPTGDILGLSSLTPLDCWRRCGEAKITWCHRTAKDFFDEDQPAAKFLDFDTHLNDNGVVVPATHLAEEVIECLVVRGVLELRSTSQTERKALTSLSFPNSKQLTNICDFLALLDTADWNIKQTAIDFVHHVDKCIVYVCDWCGWARDDFWEAVWADKKGDAAKWTWKSTNSRPTDFFTFAASSGVYFHVEDRLDRAGQSLSLSEIQLLACHVAWTTHERCDSNNLRQLKLVTRLIQMGVDVHASDGYTTIWEEALHHIYAIRLESEDDWEHRIRLTSGRGTPADLTSMIEMLLQNGADPYPVLSARLEGSRGSLCWMDPVLSEPSTSRRILEKPTTGETAQTRSIAWQLFSPHVYIRDSLSVGLVEGLLEVNRYDLNDKTSRQIYGLIDQVFDRQGKLSLDFKDQIIRQVRAILPRDTGETIRLERYICKG